MNLNKKSHGQRIWTSLFALAFATFIVAAAMPGSSQVNSNDTDVAHTLTTAGELNILQANLAIQTSENDNVRAYAKELISASKTVIDSVAAFTESLGIVPTENKWSDSLEALSDATVASLEELTGSAFDAQFAAEQVTYQKNLANIIEMDLLGVTHRDRLQLIATQMNKHALDLSDKATALQGMIEM